MAEIKEKIMASNFFLLLTGPCFVMEGGLVIGVETRVWREGEKRKKEELG